MRFVPAADSFVWYVAKRFLAALAVLFVVVSLTFLAMRLAPGSPFTTERAIPKAVLSQLEARYHLNGGLGQQYTDYLGQLSGGDLGPSLRYKNRTVAEILFQCFPVSLTLGSCAFVVAMALGVGLGTFAAVRHNTAGDRGAMLV
ncbi:MAG TPA: hypothetical protein VIM58_09130, partial [Candidatus Methylacidiphilales bacterium]